HVFHDSSTSSGASKSVAIHAENKFSVARSQLLRTGQRRPGAAFGPGGFWALTVISCVIVLHPAGAPSRTSVARQVPTAGATISANQKYGGPPCRSRDLTAMLPSGAINESSPSSGFSVAMRMRSGAPFHGAIGAGRIATSALSAQVPDGA